MKAGDLITTTHKGFHRVDTIDGDLVYYTQMYTDSGCVSAAVGNSCHIKHCHPALAGVENRITEAQAAVERLTALRERLTCNG
jgi:hypothetical protein